MGRQGPRLRRQLGFWDTVALGLGAVIGAGVFVVLGEVAGLADGLIPAAILLAALVAVLDSLSAVQLGVNYPRVGGTYEFGYQLLSPWAGFSAGLMYLLANVTAGATLSLAFADYLHPIVPGVSLRIIAIVVAALALLVNLAGAQQSRRVNNVLVVFKVSVLIIFVGVGLAFLGGWQPFTLSPSAPSGLLRGSALFFFAFTGFARPVTIVEEIRNPTRNLPRALITALALTTVLYLAVAVVSLGLVGPAGLAGTAAPLRVALVPTGQGWALFLVSIGALVATLSVLLTDIWALSRVVLAMARRGDLPEPLGRINARGLPMLAVLLSGAIVILLTATLTFGPALAASSLAALVYYGLTNGAALRLTPQQRLYPWPVPALGLIATAALAFSLPSASLIGIAVVLALGLLYFFLWRRLRNRRPPG